MRRRHAGQNWVPAFAGMHGYMGDRYFFPGGVVNGELPTDTAGLGFSAFGFRVSLLLRT